MYRRFVQKSIVFVLMVLLLSVGGLFALPKEAVQASDIKLIINGQLMDTQQVALISDRTFVPLRMIGEHLGLEVKWEAQTRTVEMNGSDLKLTFAIDNTSYSANGQTKTLDVPPTIIDGSTLVPLRVVGEYLGQVEWHPETRTVVVNSFKERPPGSSASPKKPIQLPVSATIVESTDANEVAQRIISGVFYNYLTGGVTKHTFTITDASMNDVVNILKNDFPTSQFLEVTPLFSLQGNVLIIDLAGSNETVRQNFQEAYGTLSHTAYEINKQTTDPVKRRQLATDYLCQHWQYQYGASKSDLSQYSLYSAVISGHSVCAGIESYASLLFNKLGIPAYRVNYYQTEIPLVGHTVTCYLENGHWYYVNFTMLDDRYDRGLGSDYLSNYWRQYDHIGSYRLYSDSPDANLVTSFISRLQKG